MIIIASKEERELLTRLRTLPLENVSGLTAEALQLKRQIADLQIEKSKREEGHAREERELRHMIGLEKKRQEVEIAQAKRDTELTVREGNLKADQQRFEDQLKFNTQRFETMEKYLKDMLSDILQRLPTVTVDMKRGDGHGKR